MAFNTALSGLNAAAADLRVTGQNIANASTVGFKRSRAEFGDVYASTLLGNGTNLIGSGVKLANVAQQFEQGTIGFTKAISAELGEYGIRANAICPGLVDGPRIQSVIANKARSMNVSHEEMTDRLFAGVSIKQFVDPNDIAKQIVFLASPFGKTISGQEISVCGDTRMLS